MNLVKTNNDKIVVFASGEFPVATIEYLIEKKLNIVGIVTSNYRNKFKERSTKNIIQIAQDNNIDYIIPRDVNDSDTIAWLKDKDADVFCVISYKMLSNEILNLPKKIAFNVHGSVLPDLRGASPINYAIRYGYQKTGLTVFILSDKVDCGHIIKNHIVEITDDMNFGDLFWKLSDCCVEFTFSVIEKISKDCEHIKKYAIPQNNESHVFNRAPKLTDEYTKHWFDLNSVDIKNLCRSVNPVDGIYVSFSIYKNDTNELVNTLVGKIYDVTIVDGVNAYKLPYLTDKKKYLYIANKFNNYISVNEIQLAGKKRMSIQSFLCGYAKVLFNERYFIQISDC